MMSTSLYRLGHLAARRPWVVIGSWLVLAVVVVGASGAFGHRLKDSMQVPGLDSQQASELMAAAGASDAGLTAQVVVTPLDDDATFLDSPEARSALATLQRDAAALPHVLKTTQVVSPDGRVALIRLQYPLVDELSAEDLSNLKTFGAEAGRGLRCGSRWVATSTRRSSSRSPPWASSSGCWLLRSSSSSPSGR